MNGRIAVLLAGADGVTLGVYARADSGVLRAHVRRAVALTGATWPALREALRPLVALARERGAREVTIAVRASVKGPRGAAGDARRLRCELLRLSVEDELRLLFLGGVRKVSAQDGVIAELEPFGVSLARFRGRVLAAVARIGLGERPASSGLALGGEAGVLVVSGSLANAGGSAAAALKRLRSWTGSAAPVFARDALAVGLAATLLRAPVPDASRATRS